MSDKGAPCKRLNNRVGTRRFGRAHFLIQRGVLLVLLVFVLRNERESSRGKPGRVNTIISVYHFTPVSDETSSTGARPRVPFLSV